MSRLPRPRQPGNNGHNTADAGNNGHSSGNRPPAEIYPIETGESTPGLRIITASSGRLALSRLDWVSAILLALATAIAPIWVATFATPPGAQSLVGNYGGNATGVDIFMAVWSGPIVLALIASAFCVMAYREWKRPVAIGAVPGLAGAFGLLGIWATLSTLNNPAIFISLNTLSFLFACILAAGMISRLGRDRTALLVLILTIAGAGGITSGIGVNEYLQYWKIHDFAHRTFATFLNPDFLAGYLVLTLPLTLAAFTAVNNRTVRLCTGLALALQTACLMLTASRSGIAVAGLSILVFLGIAAWTRALQRRGKVAASAVLIIAAAGGLGSAPTLSRFVPADSAARRTVAAVTLEQSPDAQAHSGAFRKWTWIGSVHMALRNPVLGTGIGTFDTAYPRYAQTAYTSHAHNSFLQWTAETGFPGVLLLMTGLAAQAAFVANILLLTRPQARKSSSLPEDVAQNPVSTAGDSSGDALAEPRLLLAGLCAALAGSMLHSLFDSDWYLVASLLTLCAVLGLLTAQARALAPLATRRPRILGRELSAIGLLICVFLYWRAAQTGLSRWEQAQSAESVAMAQTLARAHSPAVQTAAEEAVRHARSAVAADPFDPEPHLLLAQFSAGSPAAEADLQVAARLAPSGKTFYLLGKYYLKAHQQQEALKALEHARELEPNNLQTLHLLADTQLNAGLPGPARTTYQTMTILETAPYGTVRAMPEYVETEFAYAHAQLADMAFAEHKLLEADAEYTGAASVLRRYWTARHWGVNEARQPEKRRALLDLYLHVLSQWRQVLQQEGKKQETQAVAKEQADVEAEADTDRKAEQNAQQL